MHFVKKLTGAALVAVAATAAMPSLAASADDGGGGHGADHAVFVQTVEASGNHVLAFRRGDDGSLTPSGSYATGGAGVAASGAVVDPLASQGGLTYDASHGLLFAVNSASNTVSVFSADGDHLALRQTFASGGTFPASVAVRDDVVEVLNAGGAGALASFHLRGRGVDPVAASVRGLGLSNDPVAPDFLKSPGQVGFSRDGRFVIVTTKANNQILTFRVRGDGRLAAAPVVTPSAGPVPFAFEVDRAGRLVVVEAGSGIVRTYRLNGDGSLTAIGAAAGGQKAACWIVAAKGRYYVANAGSATLSGYEVDAAGQVSLVGATGVVATTGAGPIDLAASARGNFVYVQEGGAHAVHAFAVQPDGSLTSIGTWAGLPAMEGIVAR